MGVPSEKLNNALQSIENGIERIQEITAEDIDDLGDDDVEKIDMLAVSLFRLSTRITMQKERDNVSCDMDALEDEYRAWGGNFDDLPIKVESKIVIDSYS